MTFKELLNRVRFDDVAHKLSLRFVSKREAFCMETESVLYQNGGRFVWKRKAFTLTFDFPTKTTFLGLFDFRSFFNYGMLWNKILSKDIMLK
jgi:hypothetical protein